MFEDLNRLTEALREEGVVDTHYHVGPELIVRRYDVKTLADVAVPFGATLVLKNHTYPTTPLASLARAHFDARFFGGIVLNRYVGGLNPQAVESACSGNRTYASRGEPDPSPVVVWMPTVHARSHLQVHGFAFDPRWSGCCTHGHADHTDPNSRTAAEPVIVFEDNGCPASELIPTLEAIARNKCVLASGHLHAEEVKRLVPMALEIGVKRIILTHPHYPSIRLADEDLKMLTLHPEVFIEHCFAIHTQDGVPLEAYADSIRVTGSEQVLLSTDFGQVSSDPFPEGTLRYAAALASLLKGKVSRAAFLGMFTSNGRRALGIA